MQKLLHIFVGLTVPKQRIGVALVLLNEHQQVLLLEHIFHPMAPWGLPSGWLKRNESPQAGALRELREETGLTALIKAPLLVGSIPDAAQIEIVFLAQLSADIREIKLNRELLSHGWFDIQRLPSGMTHSAYAAIEAAAQHTRIHVQTITTQEI